MGYNYLEHKLILRHKHTRIYSTTRKQTPKKSPQNFKKKCTNRLFIDWKKSAIPAQKLDQGGETGLQPILRWSVVQNNKKHVENKT